MVMTDRKRDEDVLPSLLLTPVKPASLGSSRLSGPSPASVPLLPIPRLENSIARYLRAQEPLLTADQFRRTTAFSHDFQHGLGRELHDMLIFQDQHSQHTSYISGQGFDRHLLALRILADSKKGYLPDIFLDSAYDQLNHSLIFSRHLSNPTLNFGASMPIVPDGFGITYLIQDDCIIFNVTSCSDYNIQDFIQSLKISLEKIIAVLKGKPITH
uniref:Carnitine O-palmitoyltransferase 2, mitochondrial n=1 Tax=Vombatus ursinus TaxID=29139 RepID=A0A4X2LHI2_VOMUR